MAKTTKIIFFGVKPPERKYLSEKLKVSGLPVEAEFFAEIANDGVLANQKDAEIISVFVDSALDEKIFDCLPNLKFVAVRATGYDNVDLKIAEKRGIKVSNVPAYGENTVAEFAFALMLALSRKICQATAQVKETGNFSYGNLQGFDLRGKTLGVIGTGKIGRHVIKMADGFDMKVVAFDSFPDANFAQTAGFQYVSLEELLKQSDIVTVHVPYLKTTHHLLNKSNLALMKKGAYLINTSRGAVVETEALAEVLKNGRLGGAGLDVLEEEGVLKDELAFALNGDMTNHNLKAVLADHALIDMPNVLVTPHNAFNTKEALERILDTTVENIKAFLDGKPENLISAR